jgi:DNA-binding NarL/FixJ family response regulator
VIKKWRNYVFHPLIIGFILSLIVIFLFARYLPRFYTEIVEESVLTNNGEVYYFDLNKDGNSEKLHYYHYDRIFKPTLYLYDSNDNFKSLWNFLELPVKNYKIFTGDYNNDSIEEIFVFTQSPDSLFLYVLNSENDREPYTRSRFITTLSNPESEVHILPIGLYNLNQNENKEFLFAVDAGYPYTPSKIFSFDISSNVLSSSPEIKANISKPILVEDINFDTKPEIVISNQSAEVPGNGNGSGLIVLNNKLQYLFQPIVFTGGASQITVDAIKYGNEKLLAVLHSGTKPENVFNSLMLYNFSGEKVYEVTIANKSNLVLTCISENENKIYLFNGKKIYRYNSELKKEKTYTISKGNKTECIQRVDITGDAKEEMIFRSNKNIIITSDNIRHKVKLNLPDKGKLNITIAKHKHKHKPNQVSIQIGSKWYLCEFYKNEAFFYSHIFYLSIYILISFIVFLILKIRLRIRRFQKSIRNNESDLFNQVEDNIEENFTGLKSKIKEISNELTDDSYNKIIVEIDDTLEKVKTASKIVSSKYSTDEDFENQLSNLVSSKKDKINISYRLFPDYGFSTISQKIKETILEYADNCFDFIANHSKNINLVLQVIQQNDYLNLLMEIENIFIDSTEFESNSKLKSILNKVKGELVIDNFSGFGTIINATIPLNITSDSVESKKRKIRIIIAEDHDVSLFGLVSLFKTKDDIEIVGTAKNGMEVLKILETKNTDIVITDISMPGMDGIELSEKLKNEYPNIKVIVFTMYLENWFVEQLIANGAKGLVSKNSKIIELIGAVRNVYEGNNYYCPQFKSKFGLKGNNNGISKKLDSLTKNELYIVNLYAENLSKEQIASKMNLNRKTMDAFIANILLKLNAGDEEEIIRIAKKQKFVSE